MVDHLDGDAATCRFVKGAGGVTMQGLPCLFIDLCLEGGAQGFVGVIGPEKVGVTHKKALLIVVGVYKPAGDALRPAAAYFARLGMKHIHTVEF